MANALRISLDNQVQSLTFDTSTRRLPVFVGDNKRSIVDCDDTKTGTSVTVPPMAEKTLRESLRRLQQRYSLIPVA